MTPELIGIISVGAAIGVLNLALWRDVRADVAALRADVAALRADVQSLGRRVSRIEGVIEGLLAGMNGRSARRVEQEDAPSP